MLVKEIDINTGKIKGYRICNKKYKISFLGGPTTPTYSIYIVLLCLVTFSHFLRGVNQFVATFLFFAQTGRAITNWTKKIQIIKKKISSELRNLGRTSLTRNLHSSLLSSYWVDRLQTDKPRTPL